MSKSVTLGGDRLGSGKKMKVHLHGYERSTFDLGYPWRSTMSAGTLVPFICEVALPGDTFDIKLSAFVNTHPTVGPLFGTYKLQLDVFKADIRLYQALLHNNALEIGRNMQNVKFPIVKLWAYPNANHNDIDNSQVNPSCIFSYLGIRGVAYNATSTPVARNFNAIPWLAYWDIYKNYYANKQETVGAVIHSPKPTINTTVTAITINTTGLPQSPATNIVTFRNGDAIGIDYAGLPPDPATILVNFFTPNVVTLSMADLVEAGGFTDNGSSLLGTYNWPRWGDQAATNWDYQTPTQVGIVPPRVEQFVLSDLDEMRNAILQKPGNSAFVVNDYNDLSPYNFIATPGADPDYNPLIQSQEGLAIKTYQSDMFNNWLNHTWISGISGINEITAINTSGGSFKLDQLYLANKIYQMLNRVAVSDGSYDGWLNAVYTHERYVNTEIPTYHGGLIKEVIFQEVISNSAANNEGGGNQPLGTLAGKGTLSDKHKGGTIRIKVDEPAYIMGIVSLTPRIDYSQGNRWFTYSLFTMDDLHKPALDQIGFQDLRTETQAWWSTFWNGTEFKPAYWGKQTAWIHYQTNVPRTYGNFAIQSNEMFMTLNRRYEPLELGGPIPVIVKDLTTYIDPAKYNNIFAQTSLDAQNFWVQIGVDMMVRRKMSSKIMPNL